MTMRRQIRTAPSLSVSKLRKDLGVTRGQFARLVQASERSIAKWEHGEPPGPPHASLLSQLQRIYETASKVMKPSYVGPWLESPLEALGGLNPREAMERGEHDRVWRLLFAVESGGYS